MTTTTSNQSRASKRIVTYEIHYGRPAEPDDPGATVVEHLGGQIYVVYDVTVPVKFTYPMPVPEAKWASDKSKRAAAHKGLRQARVESTLPPHPGADPDFMVPMAVEVAEVQER